MGGILMGVECFPFVVHVARGKWLAFYAAMMVMVGATNSANFLETIAIVSSINNFPMSRDVVVGILKGLVGIVTQFSYGILKPQLTQF